MLLKLLIIFPFLILSAELITRGAEKLEKFMGQGMAGGIIMGLLTALPETIFVIVAILREEPYIALGSAIGGNVLLFTFGIGLLGVMNYFKWRKDLIIAEEYGVEQRFLIFTTILLLFLLLYNTLDIIIAIPLIFLYFYYAFTRVKGFINRSKGEIDYNEIVKATIYLTVGAVLLVFFSEPFVEEVAQISQELHIPSVWLALILTPLAGEIEETITAIRLTSNSQSGGSLAVFDFVGSKIENSTILLAIIGVFHGIQLQPATSELIATIIANTLAIFILMDRTLGLKESIALILIYFLVAYSTLAF